MNKIIKDLLDDATEVVDNWKTGTSRTEVDYKIFADLIIKECIKICQSRAGNSDYNTGRMHCVSDIKEHFGIKE